MDTAQIISIIISVAAFMVAAYGIVERRVAATRTERIRLTTIVENMVQIRKELIELSQQGQTSGNIIEAISARLEILAQQAIFLVQRHSLTITSTECREIAIGLEQAGYLEDADFMWDMAHERAKKEGDTQELYASRGHAYYLFRSQRATEAREMLQEALSRHVTDTDTKRLAHAETLVAWTAAETALEGPQAQLVAQLTRQLANLKNTFSTPRGKAMFDNAVKGIDIASIENTQS